MIATDITIHIDIHKPLKPSKRSKPFKPFKPLKKHPYETLAFTQNLNVAPSFNSFELRIQRIISPFIAK